MALSFGNLWNVLSFSIRTSILELLCFTCHIFIFFETQTVESEAWGLSAGSSQLSTIPRAFCGIKGLTQGSNGCMTIVSRPGPEQLSYLRHRGSTHWATHKQSTVKPCPAWQDEPKEKRKMCVGWRKKESEWEVKKVLREDGENRVTKFNQVRRTINGDVHYERVCVSGKVFKSGAGGYCEKCVKVLEKKAQRRHAVHDSVTK